MKTSKKPNSKEHQFYQRYPGAAKSDHLVIRKDYGLMHCCEVERTKKNNDRSQVRVINLKGRTPFDDKRDKRDSNYCIQRNYSYKDGPVFGETETTKARCLGSQYESPDKAICFFPLGF